MSEQVNSTLERIQGPIQGIVSTVKRRHNLLEVRTVVVKRTRNVSSNTKEAIMQARRQGSYLASMSEPERRRGRVKAMGTVLFVFARRDRVQDRGGTG